MQNNHPTITYAYHFMSEAIIIFLLALPIMHFHYEWGPPYWSYLAIILLICFVFSVLTTYTKHYLWYIGLVPFMVGLFYVCDYPMVMSVSFSVLLTWRYSNIRQEGMISRENSYILFTIVLTTILLLWIEENRVLLYLFFQFILLVAGYISSHAAIVNKHERKQFDHRFWLYISLFLALGASVVFLLFDTVRYIITSIWNGITYLLGYGASMLAGFFGDIDYEAEQHPETIESVQYQEESELGTSILDGVATYILSYLGITILIIGIVIVLVLMLHKRKFTALKQPEVNESVSYSTLGEQTKGKAFAKSRLTSLFKRPKHPARKMVFQFERQAAQSNYGRLKFETIEEWLRRLGIHTQLAVYQKARYGDENVSDKELEELNEQLEKIKFELFKHGN
ncbi:cytochrome c biogenesis protein CcdA [Virgibacillus natechei]|uniref:Cytochrome c biogenesis protein CcdA n=1 Tax=Virgibacillus natechei TaxID=1216297 RepID=A0ABS4IHL6_9BACI|nr:hypothetical protein [Virgibacillus natechei]MBP1969489.1 cytochrome c biogenesis protein CcdA [Virgibacillus natechei]UZD11807.1 hypothetical protein OLD84_12725 [Virgibacillus natechei]